jgi:asparagine synthase (glutamine-hydrolysing)
MTALAGYWSFGDPAEADRNCQRMLKSQSVYAPNPQICRGEGPVMLGRRLFKLLPEDSFDSGPVASGPRLLVADLRLDNREELAASLGLSPGDSARLADSALLMRALDRWDLDAMSRLVGEFAFALWDGAERRLVLARDHIGQRPLHYHRAEGFFAFASMPKGLHALAELPVAPNRAVAADFLALIPETGNETFFEGVEKVRPGHYAIVTPGGIAEHRYWQPSPAPLRLRGPEEYREALREQLDRAVGSQLRGADGHVAAQLSGGLDSSAVAATAARLLAPTGGRVTGFTSVPREGYRGGIANAISDEGPLAAAVASLYPNMGHVLIRSGASSPLAGLDRYFYLYERPMLNLSNGVWLDAILSAAKDRRLKVLLSGAMGNMSFSYDGMQLLPDLLARGRLLRLGREIVALLGSGTRAGTIAAQTIGPFLPRPVWKAIGRLRGKVAGISDYSAINPASAAALGIAQRAAARGLDLDYRPRRDPFATRLWALSRVDMGNYHKGMLGGWGVDVRDPTADRRLIEFCLSVPADQFLRAGLPRALAREALADRLPGAVLTERRKGYQAADWHEGLNEVRGELREEVARLGEIPIAADALDTEKMAGLVEQWPEGGWNSDLVRGRYRLALLRGVSAGHFLRKAAGLNR